VHEKDLITPTKLRTFHAIQIHWTAKDLMSVHSHKNINGRYHRVPHLFEVDLSAISWSLEK
jgi:hypothetical protein